MIGLADFIQLGGFLAEFSFLGFNKSIRKFHPVGDNQTFFQLI